MAQDRVLRAFAGGAEEVGDSVRRRIESIEHQLDIGLASPGMLRFVAGWLGLALDPADDVDHQRAVVRATGSVLGWRGTRRGVEDLLQALTGGRAEVTDGGGIFAPGDDLPAASEIVRVEVDSTGPLSEDQVRAYLADELPAGAVLDLHVRHPQPPRSVARADDGA
jgi:phage tail-like protein